MLADECEDVLLGAEIMRELGQVCAVDGELDEAREAWTVAGQRFNTVGAMADVTGVTNHLRLLR